jgi:hypothetical protein
VSLPELKTVFIKLLNPPAEMKKRIQELDKVKDRASFSR